MYYYDYNYRTDLDLSLLNDITKAINGEYSAIACYEGLARLAPTDDARKQILEIRQDEIKHLNVFSQIYTAMTGKQPTPQIVESCPSDYRAGLNFAFKDEQDTVDFYQEIADKAINPQIKEAFKRASTDEQNHAVWFLYFLTYNH
ncbi:ferritin-like domain-containing protein [Paenibacillus cellulositrophicus]|uniref:ferritin-like domain-containing protein n=1 Tax=Paenibacillus cellulositrophicus TaxID=562959 RepID=UPI003D9973F4